MQEHEMRIARIKLAASMVIFGTIGLFVRAVGMPSSMIAMVRGYLGFLFLAAVSRLRRTPLFGTAFRENAFLLILSGAMIGVNWILLFEAYRYTTVAVATLCYYMQPVLLTIGATVFLKEKLTGRKVLCIAAAFLGMLLVSGVFSVNGNAAGTDGRTFAGVLLGLGAAVFYAAVILCNKKIKPMDPLSQTAAQLLFAAVTATPYVLLTVRKDDIRITQLSVVLLLIVCFFHTGFAYVLYFGQLQKLPAQTVAVFSYIDPVTAVLLSALFLKEPLGISGLIGAVLIIGAAVFGERTS